MARYTLALQSATAAIDWTDMKASGQPLNGVDAGAVVIRTWPATRVAVGVADPGTSGTAGVATREGEATTVLLGTAAANQTIWVMTPADQSKVQVEIDVGAAGRLIAAFA